MYPSLPAQAYDGKRNGGNNDGLIVLHLYVSRDVREDRDACVGAPPLGA